MFFKSKTETVSEVPALPEVAVDLGMSPSLQAAIDYVETLRRRVRHGQGHRFGSTVAPVGGGAG